MGIFGGVEVRCYYLGLMVCVLVSSLVIWKSVSGSVLVLCEKKELWSI